MQDSYSTQLTPEQEAAYQQWRISLPPELQNEQDYDLRGAFLESAQADGRAHMTDRFKKPNHITFSEGSQYSTAQQPGGRWVDTGQNALAPNYTFWASPANAQQNSMNALADYFKRNEPGSTVIYPSNYQLPRQ
jgi:hypothetical protein